MALLKAKVGSERILAKLDKLVDSEEYYEAHQLYRTIYFRYLNGNKFKELQKLLYDGAYNLLDKKQFNSGADLAVLFIDSLNQDPNIADALQDERESQELCKKIGTLMSMIPKNTPERLNFILTTLKLKPNVFPLYSIHRQFALITWKEGDFSDSRYHFLHCSPSSSEDCASMLIDFQTSRGYPSEVDLFLAQFILQLLCLKKANYEPTSDNIHHYKASSSIIDDLNLSKITPKSKQHAFANMIIQIYVEKHPLINASYPPFDQPLINFIWFLSLAIEGGKPDNFTMLCEIYANSLGRDPAFKDYLIRIGDLYFGIKPPQTNRGLGGFLSNFLQSFAEDNDEEMDDEASSVPSQSSVSQVVGGEDLD